MCREVAVRGPFFSRHFRKNANKHPSGHHQIAMAWYDYHYSYGIQREVTVPWFRPFLFAAGLIYIIVITLVNVKAQGYNIIVYSSTDYNGTHNLWYDPLVPSKGVNYSHRQCESALIRVNDCTYTSEKLSNGRRFDKQ